MISKMYCYVLLISLLIGGLIIYTCHTRRKGIKVVKEETVYAFNKSSFKIPAGWQLDEKKMALISPEKDVTLYFLQMPIANSIEELALKAWQSIDPHFALKVLQKIDLPAQDGWEKSYVVAYDVPAAESRNVVALIRILQGIAYINLIDGSLAGFSRRGAQVNLAIESWRPDNLQREDLNGKKAKIFSESMAENLTTFIKNGMEQLDVPGASIAIIQDNRVVFSKGFGTTKKGGGVEVTPETLFMIGSITKSFTSLMMAKLVELKKIDWETPVVKILPNFKLAAPDLTNNLLMKDTVSANTGMPRRDAELLLAPADSGENTIKQMATMMPTTAFGETFQYSNHLVALGGFAAASSYKDTGSLYEKYYASMHDLIFTPLGMNHTIIFPTEEAKPYMAYPHAMDFNMHTVAMPQSQENWVYSIAPAGSAWSNVEDMAKYIIMELNKGRDAKGNKLFSEEQIVKRRMPAIKISDDSAYGLGMLISKEKGLNVVGHGGGTFGFASYLFFLPEQSLGMIVLTNSDSGGLLNGAIKQRLFELLFDAKPSANEQIAAAIKQRNSSFKILHERIATEFHKIAWIGDYVGSYHNDDLGNLTISKTENGFKLRINNKIESLLGSKEDVNGTLLIALTSEPLIDWNFQVQKEPVKRLTLDMDQMKYDFYADL